MIGIYKITNKNNGKIYIGQSNNVEKRISEQNKTKTLLTKEEVLYYRQYYVNHTMKEVYNKFLQDKGEILKEKTFKSIIIGDVRENSIYKEVPIYKKIKKVWELNGEPVSTILESEE